LFSQNRLFREDIRGFEPRMALDGGSSGLETITKVIIKRKNYSKPEGICLWKLEMDNPTWYQVC
jgi:methylase of polypeptide subunit release factors